MTGPPAHYFPQAGQEVGARPIDMWDFHPFEPGYRRELTDLTVFRRYAFSPSTERVRLDGKKSEVEFKAYGPGDRLVWLHFESPSRQEVMNLQILYHWLRQAGKIEE